MIDVLAVGETMAAVAPTAADPLETAQAFTLSTAGAESNVAQWLAERGHRVGWAGRVGNDPLGRRITQQLAGRGIDLSWVGVHPSAPTGVMFKDPGAGSTSVHYYRTNSAAATMGPEVAAGLPWGQLRLLHLTGITPALSASCAVLVRALFDRARAEGVPVSFDVNFRPALWPAPVAAMVLAELASQANYVFVGLDEAQTLWPGLEAAADVRRLLPAPGTLIVKDGATGATEFDGDGATFVPARRVDVVELVGAGDAFAAGYLSATLDGVGAAGRLGRGHEFAARALASTHDFQALEETAASHE